MGRCCFDKIIAGVIFSLSFTWNTAEARCLLADKFRQEGKKTQEIIAINACAVQYNDDESQMKMAELLMNGSNEVQKDEFEALYMYQLAAETGNAEAQVKLAEILTGFDTSSERRSQLKGYQERLQTIPNTSSAFKGEILHPYTLLLLASERPENKWYYPSSSRAAPARASALLSSYKISPEKKQAALNDASRWKTRKLLEAAKEVLSDSEYEDFENRLKNNSTRTEATNQLKERITNYIENKKKERAISL